MISQEEYNNIERTRELIEIQEAYIETLEERNKKLEAIINKILILCS